MVTGFSYIARPRLTSALLERGRFVGVTGPIGAGKTALLEELRESSGDSQSICLVVLCNARASRVEIWYTAMTELSAAGSVSPVPFGAMHDNRVDRWIDQIASIRDPLILCFDGLESREADFDIRGLLDRNPNLRVIATSRTGGRFDHTAAFSDSYVLTCTDLLFTESEAALFLKARTGKDVDLQARMLPAQAVAASIAIMNGRRVRSATEVADVYLDTLTRNPADADPYLREVLAALAVPSSADGDLIRHLVGDHMNCCEVAEEMGVLATSHESGQNYSVVEPYRQILRTELAETDPARFVELNLVAARWAFDQANWSEAFFRSLNAENYHLATEVLKFDNSMLLPETRAELISQLEHMSVQDRGRFPMLSLVLGVAYLAEGAFRRAQVNFGFSYRGAERRGDDSDPVERLILKGAQTMALRLGGRFRAAANAGREISAIVQGLRPSQLVSAQRGVYIALSGAVASMFLDGDIDGSLKLVRLASAVTSPGSTLLYFAYSLEAGILAFTGDIAGAKKVLARSDIVNTSPSVRGSYFGYFSQLARTLVALESFDIDSARASLDAISTDFSTVEFWPFELVASALVHLKMSKVDFALEEISASLRDGAHTPTSRTAMLWIRYTQALLLMAKGDYLNAGMLLEGNDDPHGVALNALRLVLTGEAEKGVISASRVFENDATPYRDRVIAAVAAAVGNHRLGDEENAANFASRLSVLCHVYGYATPLQWVPTDVCEWLADATGVTVPRLADTLFPSRESPQILLSPREREVLSAMADYENRPAVAEALHVSVNTVKTQMQSVYKKLDVSDWHAAVMRAAQLGLLPPRQ